MSVTYCKSGAPFQASHGTESTGAQGAAGQDDVEQSAHRNVQDAATRRLVPRPVGRRIRIRGAAQETAGRGSASCSKETERERAQFCQELRVVEWRLYMRLHLHVYICVFSRKS